MPKQLLSQKDYKQTKQKVIEESAYGVGFFDGIFSHLPDYALVDAVKEIAQEGFISPETDDGTIRNMLVTEAIKVMNYQDFKEVAPYLFSYPLEQREADRLVQPITISPDYFKALQEKADELFYLKEDIQQLQERIDKKMEELETARVPNGDQVIGLDMEKEELLLLRLPHNVYIDDWEVTHDNLLVDYRSNLTPYQQICDYLVANDKSIEILAYEYVLDNDLYRGYVDVDQYAISELQPTDVPNFNTQREFYEYAIQFDSFNEQYSTYDRYIMARYQFVYEYSPLEYHSFAEEFLRDKDDEINHILSMQDRELVWHEVRGSSQGKSWDLAYLRDIHKETRETVLDYLEHEVGAYYRGSLTELAVIKFENIDIDNGFNGSQEAVYYIDQDELFQEPFETVMQRYPELARFTDVKEVEQQQEQSLTQELSSMELGRSL